MSLGGDDGDTLGGTARHPARGRVRAGLRDEHVGPSLGASKNTPAEIVSKLNKKINAGLADPRQVGRRVDPSSDMIGTSTCN
jgi:hypothetical protein